MHMQHFEGSYLKKKKGMIDSYALGATVQHRTTNMATTTTVTVFGLQHAQLY